MLDLRHIQNHNEAQNLEPHWGYADRVVPCTNDVGSCQYLDSVYRAHDLGMLYSGIIWATIGTILLVLGICTRVCHAAKSTRRSGLDNFLDQSTSCATFVTRIRKSLAASLRCWLLPEASQGLFGRTSRLQVVILLTLVGYLSVWTFVGIEYRRWVTPVKKMPGVFNTRTGLGSFADRVGVLAYALLPFAVMLSSRESLLSLVTGIPYQHFNFLHRWLGYIIVAQSCLHTIGWTIIEVRLYQPQPLVGKEWIKQLYMIWGIVAQTLLLILCVLGFRPIVKWTGYEFFRKAHYVLAMLFIGACWGHWKQLKCFLVPALLLWFLDRGARLVRTWLIHYQFLDGKMVCTSAQAFITHFPDDVNGDIVRLDFDFPHDAWSVGQHFYLCFPELSIWQFHPFTPLSRALHSTTHQHHSYLVCARRGETRNLAQLAYDRSTGQQCHLDMARPKTSVVLSGPYGESITSDLENDINVLCIAGGTGITYVLPVLLQIISQSPRKNRMITCVWAVRSENNIDWIRPEIHALEEAIMTHNIKMKIHITRETCNSTDIEANLAPVESKRPELSSRSSDDKAQEVHKAEEKRNSELEDSLLVRGLKRPNLEIVVADFLGDVIGGSTVVYASGPGGMISDLRQVVARCNSGSKVWKGDWRHDVNLICDNRLEW